MAQIEISIDPKHEDEYNTKLYNALMKGDEAEVIHLCKKIKEGPLHILTTHNDTILHMATYCNHNHKDLVLNLLDLLPAEENSSKSLMFQNKIGNTVFHDAATSDRLVPAATKMLHICPQLLGIRNFCGETALFRAARFGIIDMYEFLEGEVIKFVQSNDGADYRDFHVRDDKTNILHISILAKHFDLAILIVKKHGYLAGEKDGRGMTGLQLLACNSSSFLSGNKISSLEKLFYKSVLVEDSAAQGEVKTCCTVPLWEAIQLKRRRYKSAWELTKFLIKIDTSCANAEYAMIPSKKDPESPLILATKSGITEIVREILVRYPHAVEHVSAKGHNILQLAIKYRRIEIFELVENMVVPMKRLIRKIDDNGNSLLDMVSVMAHDDDEAEDMRSPVFRLQEVLLLYERVKNISSSHFIKPNNSEGHTPEMPLKKITSQLRSDNSEGHTSEMLFKKSTSQLCSDAKEWTKRTAENCSIVAVLIATVAFAAAYTVPGGPDDKTGYPILLDQAFFITFTMADVLSLAFALSSVITFLSILTSPFQLKDFKHYYLPQRLMLGFTLLMLSVSMMMLAFAATIILMIHTNKNWIKIALYSVAFLPVAIFAFSYLPLYTSLIETFIYSLRIIGLAFPCCNRDHRFRSCLANVFNFK